jgi:hypothetical protein
MELFSLNKLDPSGNFHSFNSRIHEYLHSSRITHTITDETFRSCKNFYEMQDDVFITLKYML